MPKLGMEPIRKAAIVKATIAEIGVSGAADVTVGSIARRAGISSALAHHYFGGKEQIFLAAMRHILTGFGSGVRAARAGAPTHRGRVEAVIRASFEGDNFQPDVISAWLHFYVLAQNAPEVRRLLRIYQRRLHSHLAFDLRPLLGRDKAEAAAQGIGALIDGVYIRQALQDSPPDPAAAARPVLDYLDFWLEGRAPGEDEA